MKSCKLSDDKLAMRNDCEIRIRQKKLQFPFITGCSSLSNTRKKEVTYNIY